MSGANTAKVISASAPCRLYVAGIENGKAAAVAVVVAVAVEGGMAHGEGSPRRLRHGRGIGIGLPHAVAAAAAWRGMRRRPGGRCCHRSFLGSLGSCLPLLYSTVTILISPPLRLLMTPHRSGVQDGGLDERLQERSNTEQFWSSQIATAGGPTSWWLVFISTPPVLVRI